MMTVDRELRALMQTLTDAEAEELEQMMSAPADRSAEERVKARVTALAANPIEKSAGRRTRRWIYYAGTAAACLVAMISVVMYQRTRLTVPESVPPGEYAVTGTMITTTIQNGTASGSGSADSADTRDTQTGQSGSSAAAVTTQTTAFPAAEVSVTVTGSGAQTNPAASPDTSDGESGGSHTEPVSASSVYQGTATSTTGTYMSTSATEWTVPTQSTQRSAESTRYTSHTSTTPHITTTATSGTTCAESADVTTATSESTARALANERFPEFPECKTTASALFCTAAVDKNDIGLLPV